jgi:hypothetical protein
MTGDSVKEKLTALLDAQKKVISKALANARTHLKLNLKSRAQFLE